MARTADGNAGLGKLCWAETFLIMSYKKKLNKSKIDLSNTKTFEKDLADNRIIFSIAQNNATKTRSNHFNNLLVRFENMVNQINLYDF